MTTSPATLPRRRLQVARLIQQQGALIALVVLIVFGAIRYGGQFATGFNVTSFLADDAKYALVALGMTFVIMTGGIDLSVGSVAALGGVVAAKMSGGGLVPGFAAAIGVGLGVGILNALLITRLRLQPFIATLATLLSVRGLALWLAGDAAVVASRTSNFQHFGDWSVFGLPFAAILMFVFFLVGAGVLRYTSFGRAVLAVGGNEEASRLMGLRADRVKFLVYALSGLLAGLAGAFIAAQNGSVDSGAGQGWELSAIAAVVVGGTLLTGGVGSVLSTLVGVVLLQLIFNLIVFENGKHVISISPYWGSVIRGAFLLVVVLLQVRLTRGATPDSTSTSTQ